MLHCYSRWFGYSVASDTFLPFVSSYIDQMIDINFDVERIWNYEDQNIGCSRDKCSLLLNEADVPVVKRNLYKTVEITLVHRLICITNGNTF
jgi:hypothetical protein